MLYNTCQRVQREETDASGNWQRREVKDNSKKSNRFDL